VPYHDPADARRSDDRFAVERLVPGTLARRRV